jgi:hypothetical protein
MLVAYGPADRLVVAEETPLEQLLLWSRDQQLHCPSCRGNVHVRGGPGKQTQLHFAHQRGECAWSTEGESVRHMRGKMVLAQWLRTLFPEAVVTLEERLTSANRIADIFVVHADNTRQAIEFQCAPLELEEWQRRHAAYRADNIIDTWIIGVNRLEKQEAFLEGILSFAHELVFLDPLLTPPRIWMRWPTTQASMQAWEQDIHSAVSLSGWFGRRGFGATLSSDLTELQLTPRGTFAHPQRTSLQRTQRLLQQMGHAHTPDPSQFTSFLAQYLDEISIQTVMQPLLRAFIRDPELFHRWNYGRGKWDQPVTSADTQRIDRARNWLQSLTERGYSAERLREFLSLIPLIGPYAALATYFEMLLSLSRTLPS